jgi:hypothetical protein
MMRRMLSIVTVSLPLLSCTGVLDAGPSGDSTGSPGTGFAGMAGTVLASGAAGDASGGGAGRKGSGTAGAGTVTGAAGSASPGAAGATACGPGAIPADVAAAISATCIACHGTPPIAGVPSSLATYASLTAPATTDKTKSVAQVALVRMQNRTMPMPPAPLPPATAAQIAAFQAWVSAGTPASTCAGDGGAPAGGGGIADPYATPVVCTSNTMWTRGTAGSGSMDPGQACVACHSRGDGPQFALGGTVFPTAHEPDDCNGGSVASMAKVVITGADGNAVTLTPNAAGNFSYSGALAKPFTAKVTYMGRVRAMIAAQTSGDCNICHTEQGTMMAPGRIMLP